ncbi:MAG TPA: serine hydrolase domain-containing protein [Acidimicrobiales bacterium]|nr:serine hydrolase domain-containing protein [Acidimicrobiales bacterium]
MTPITTLARSADGVHAEDAGFDATRLARIDDHLRRRYVDAGKIAGCQVAVVRHGRLAHHSSLGVTDLERGTPVADDTIWRLYSMTKPVTGVALLSLYERGRFRLSDPVERFIPEFRGLQVQERAEDGTKRLVDPERPMSIRDAMMHMTGIGYGPRDARLDLASLGTTGMSSGLGKGATLQTLVERLGGEPLRFHPGTRWLYSWSTDVCARLVEVISGRAFDDYLQETIFDPLGMVDTGFSVPEGAAARFAALYTRSGDKRLVLLEDPTTSRYLRRPTFLSGGGGLVGTTADYLRFTRMLLGGGQLDGVRVLGRRSVQLMASNHLPGGGDLRGVALPGGYGEVGFDGMGFGLTVAVSNGPVATQSLGSAGEFMWGGAASTAFWVDPTEDLVAVFMTQLIPSGTFDFRGQLKTLVYSALVD